MIGSHTWNHANVKQQAKNKPEELVEHLTHTEKVIERCFLI
jgi:hypothetical protein